MAAEPLTGWLPFQSSPPLPPEAVQLVTPLEVQLRAKLPPGATVEGVGAWNVMPMVEPPLDEDEPLDELPPDELLEELEDPPLEELELLDDELLLEEPELLDELDELLELLEELE